MDESTQSENLLRKFEDFNNYALEDKDPKEVQNTPSVSPSVPGEVLTGQIQEIRGAIQKVSSNQEVNDDLGLPPEMISAEERTAMEPKLTIRLYRRFKNMLDNRPRWLFWGKKSERKIKYSKRDAPVDLAEARVTANRKSRKRRILNNLLRVGTITFVALTGARAIKPDWVPPVPIISLPDVFNAKLNPTEDGLNEDAPITPQEINNMNEQIETTPKVILDRLKRNDYNQKQLRLIYSALWDKYHTGPSGLDLDREKLYNTFKRNPEFADEIVEKWDEIVGQHSYSVPKIR